MSKSKLITSGYIKSIVGASLFEDQAQKDITTDLLVNKSSITSAKIIANEDGIIGGLDFADEAFKQIDKKTKLKKKFQEGSSIKKGDIIAEIKGLTGSILKSERTAINFLGLISGIATKTHYICAACSSCSSCARRWARRSSGWTCSCAGGVYRSRCRRENWPGRLARRYA
jgi:nicotinate-nucleotide pyrophosphorylase